MVDFTKVAFENLSFRAYGGTNGIKKGILIDDIPYMLKIEHRDRKKRNSILNEYICSKIYSLFLPTQEVILGTIEYKGKNKLCVACKDFRKDNEYLYEFLSIKNSVSIANSSNGSGTELSEILKTIDEQKFCPPEILKKRFWDMFVIDAYLGNPNRSNSDWGILVNDITKEKKLAPIYDCGSCLYPEANDEELENMLFVFPTSAIKIENQKINYYDYLTTTTDEDCLKSIRELVPKIKEKSKEIENFINSIEIISDIRKEFYCKILKLRLEKILEVALERAKNL